MVALNKNVRFPPRFCYHFQIVVCSHALEHSKHMCILCVFLPQHKICFRLCEFVQWIVISFILVSMLNVDKLSSYSAELTASCHCLKEYEFWGKTYFPATPDIPTHTTYWTVSETYLWRRSAGNEGEVDIWVIRGWFKVDLDFILHKM
jgi:hypothetical protein